MHFQVYLRFWHTKSLARLIFPIKQRSYHMYKNSDYFLSESAKSIIPLFTPNFESSEN